MRSAPAGAQLLALLLTLELALGLALLLALLMLSLTPDTVTVAQPTVTSIAATLV